MSTDFFQAIESIKGTIWSHEAQPLLYVISGSRGNQINGVNSDYDIVGIHMADVLQYPPYRGNWEVITKQISNNMSLVSYEAWKFLELLGKGAFTAFEIRDLPSIYLSAQYDRFALAMRSTKTIPTSFAFSCTGNFKSDWPKDKLSRKKAVMACFRLCQAVGMLSFGKVFHNTQELVTMVNRDIYSIPNSAVVLANYLEPHMREVALTPELSVEVDKELNGLCEWVEMTAKARKGSGINGDELSKMLQCLYQDRIAYYGSRIER